MSVPRRNVLAGLAGIGVLGIGAQTAAAQVSGKTVAVIGAGMAGLAAAGALARAGANVTVYEARGRIGGRVWTSDTWADLPCDMGASWIHGPRGNPITALAKAAGAKMVTTDYDSTASFLGGKEVAQPEPWKYAEAASEAAHEGDEDLSLQDAVSALQDVQGLNKREKATLRAAFHRAIEHEYGGDWDQLSALWYDAGEVFGGKDVLFARGYGALAAHTASGVDIQTGAQVVRIAAAQNASGQGGVEIGFADSQTVFADGAVITLPLGVLQSGSVAFDPPLSRARQRVIDRLGMGLLNKIFLRFEKRPPTPATDWLEKLDAPADVFPEWVNLAHVLGAPALLGFNAANSADEIEGWSDADTTEAATQALRAMFGAAFPTPISAQITRWRADPFALGAYSYHRLGAREDARADLGGTDWDGLIAFAGEAASTDHPSTVHGAWLSGLDAADALDI